MVRRDVAQVAVDFGGHHLIDLTVDEDETRRQLKRRAFDHLLSLALLRITEARGERADLGRQRALLQRKLRTLQKGGWGFDEVDADAESPDALQAELDATERQLAALGSDDRTLYTHLDITRALLEESERQLWSEPITLHLDRMNIQRDSTDPTARQIRLQELHNVRGRHLITQLVTIPLDELPPRDDMFTAAQRILG
jgi:hypothetical protein